jgi:hypothetical protein
MTETSSPAPVPLMAKTKVNLYFQIQSNLLSSYSFHNIHSPFIGYGNRVRMQAMQMSDWTDQQLREKRLVKEQEEFANQLLHAQNKQFT